MSFTGKRHAAKNFSLVRKSSLDQALATAVGSESDSDSEVSARNRDLGLRLRPRRSLGQSQHFADFAVDMPQRRARRKVQSPQLAVAAPQVVSLLPGLDDSLAAPASPVVVAPVVAPFSMAVDVPAAGALGLTDLLVRAPRDSFSFPNSIVFGGSLFDDFDSWGPVASDSSVASLEHASSPLSTSSGSLCVGPQPEGVLPFAAAASGGFVSSSSADESDVSVVSGK